MLYYVCKEGDDDYYTDYIPVSSPKEVDELNKNYNGYELEKECKEIFVKF